MSIIGKFILGLIFSGIILSIASLAWPKFTTKERPELIKGFQLYLKDTPFGQQVSQVLGVTDESQVKPVDLKVTAVELKDWMILQIQNKAESIVAKQAADQIRQRFSSLNEDQKTILRQAICESGSDSAIIQ